jgi:hypothetical protein
MARRLSILIGGIALAFGVVAPVAATPEFPYGWPDHSVIPVLFVPTDWSVESAEVQGEAASLRTALDEIRTFYARENGDWTFTLNPLEVVQGHGPRTKYHIIWNGRNIYEDGVDFDGNMEHEVVNELHGRGFPTPVAQNESGYSVLIFVKGAGGWAGGREFPDADGGWAILGDWTIDSIDGTVQEGAYWWSGRRLQIGASAHELGHTFDLPHPDAHGATFDTSIMGNWWDYPTTGLSDWERDHLVNVKASFFQERGGLATTWVAFDAASVSATPSGVQEAYIRRGSARTVQRDDGKWLVMKPVPAEDGYSATLTIRFDGVPNDLSTFRVLTRDRTSSVVSRSIDVIDERYGWVTLASANTARRAARSHADAPWGPPGIFVDGVEGRGDMLVRIRYASDRRFTTFVDEVSLEVEELVR